MSDHHTPIAEERIVELERQVVVIDDFAAAGPILDIGGGGEGVVGRLKGRQVVAIDRNEGELAEAPAGPLKIVMDATDLRFLDSTFAVVTSFFTLMYIKVTDHARVFGEVHRVLAPGGRFLVWDGLFPPRVAPEKDVAVLPLTVRLPDVEINTGYGVRWPEKGRDSDYYVELARHVGFEVSARQEHGQTVFLELRKPAGSAEAGTTGLLPPGERKARQVRLVTMAEVDFGRYLAAAIPEYAQEHVRAGNWDAAEAPENAAKAFHSLLPDGVATENQYLYSIEDEERAAVVGMIWFGVFSHNRSRAFICDFAIDEAFRGQGYGTAALRAVEEKVRDLGLGRIALHVFGHNRVARALYEKMGYHVTDLDMAKEL